MKILLPIISLLFLTCCASAAKKDLISDIENFQKELNSEYRNLKESPLRGSDFTNFKEHPFFPVNLKYSIVAQFIKTENAVAFEIPTSSGQNKWYREYGKAYFNLNEKNHILTLYQSLALVDKSGYEDYLFLPFRDETNSVETYGGGKYMDLRIPNSDKIILDFNKSYHPLCAYNAYDYSCPIVPAENFLSIRIEAGVMYQDIYHH